MSGRGPVKYAAENFERMDWQFAQDPCDATARRLAKAKKRLLSYFAGWPEDAFPFVLAPVAEREWPTPSKAILIASPTAASIHTLHSVTEIEQRNMNAAARKAVLEKANGTT